ncbi:MAG: PQQ-binding-like beta-propeller repeat protein [Treponema sp.]|nr:PQQ-binding-like beta-propeller repeat protein [Treponema sp.]
MKLKSFCRGLFLLLAALCSGMAFAQGGGEVAAPADTALWRQALGGAVIGRPTVQAQSVVIALDGGNVKAYSSSGRPLWDFSARGRLSPYIARSREGTSYICRNNGIFISINRVGRELWRKNVGGPLAGPVVLGWDGRVFIPMSRKVLCYTASGNLLWERELEAAISSGPWLDQGGGILLALANGDALRLNHFGAAVSWRLRSVPGILLSCGPLVLALYPNGDAQSLDMSLPDSSPVSLPRLPSAPLAAASRGGSAAVALSNGQLVAISPSEGKILWSADTRIRMQNETAVVYDERGIYVLGKNGAAGFSADGRRLWFTALENASGIPAFDDEGVLYSGGTDWILYAWKLEDRALQQRRTLYGPAPEGTYRLGIYPASAFEDAPGRFEDALVKRELEIMHRGIVSGRVGESEREWTARLMDIASGSVHQNPFSYVQRNATITHRVMALQLLSRIGSSETIPWLARFFRTENESFVKAAAAHAIGGIGIDPDGVALDEFLAVIVSEDYRRDEQVLYAIAAATGALCRFSGPPLFETGARILVTLSGTNQRPSVHERARKELDWLMGE